MSELVSFTVIISLFLWTSLLGSVACQEDVGFLRGIVDDERHLMATKETCGSTATSSQEVEETLKTVHAWKQQNPNRQLQLTTKRYKIPMYVHVILRTSVQVKTTGKVNRNNLEQQMLQVEKAFNGTPFEFYIQEFDYIVNGTWYDCDQEKVAIERAMKVRSHKGGTDALNVYICDTEPSGYRGWARFPWELSDITYDRRKDAVTISYKGVAGVDTEWFHQLLSHEIGHWLGLYHTYENGCYYPGDGVADTPAHVGPNLACTSHRNTCPDDKFHIDAGPDPLRNIMNFPCRQEFTIGQVERMTAMFETHRLRVPTFDQPPPLPTKPPVATPPDTCIPLSQPCIYTDVCCGSNTVCVGFCRIERKQVSEANFKKSDMMKLAYNGVRRGNRPGTGRRQVLLKGSST